MKCMLPALGGVLFVATAASAGVTEDWFVASAAGSGSYGFGPDTAFNSSDPFFSVGNTSSTSGNSDTDAGGWGDGAYGAYTATNTSSVSGGNYYAWSGALSAVLQQSSSNMDSVSTVASSQIRFTLDETTEVSMALSWLASVDTDSSGGISGQFGLFDRIGDQLQSELLGEWGGTGSESLTGSLTLAAGEYYFFFQLNNSVNGSTTYAAHNESNLTFQASLNLGGSPPGGAVPGLGALAPLAAAGLARRRRR